MFLRLCLVDHCVFSVFRQGGADVLSWSGRSRSRSRSIGSGSGSNVGRLSGSITTISTLQQ